MKYDLRNDAPTVKADTKLQSLLSDEERKFYQDGMMTNLAFGLPIAENFEASCFGLPLMGSSIYSHMFAGMGNYLLQKNSPSGKSLFQGVYDPSCETLKTLILNGVFFTKNHN